MHGNATAAAESTCAQSRFETVRCAITGSAATARTDTTSKGATRAMRIVGRLDSARPYSHHVSVQDLAFDAQS
jgi:hypothetical protein